jgi:hypothetical protein
MLDRTENTLLKSAGLNASMPEGWKFGDDVFARYHSVGIKFSNKFLKVVGAVCR